MAKNNYEYNRYRHRLNHERPHLREIHGCLENTTHGIAIAEGIGGCNLSEPVRAIYNRSEDVYAPHILSV